MTDLRFEIFQNMLDANVISNKDHARLVHVIMADTARLRHVQHEASARVLTEWKAMPWHLRLYATINPLSYLAMKKPNRWW